MTAITKQPPIGHSGRSGEYAIYIAGHSAHTAGVCINDNPHKGDCSCGLREHWLWDQGWRDAQQAVLEVRFVKESL